MTRQIVIQEPVGNRAPNAVIETPVCTGLVCTFSSINSSDPDRDAITRLWNFGDGGATSTSTAPTKTFAAAGTYTVSLTVTDGWGRATTVTRQVTVSTP